MILNRLLIENSENGNLAEVSRLLEKGANARTCRNAPIRKASLKGYAPIVDVLIQNGAYPLVHDLICLRYAARYGYVDVAKLILVEKNFLTLSWNDNSYYMTHSKLWGAISVAVVHGQIGFLEMLEELGFRAFPQIGKMSMEKLLGNSAYFRSWKNSNRPFLKTIRFLLERGAEIEDDLYGYTRGHFKQIFGVEMPKSTEEVIGMINIVLVHDE